MPTPYRLQRLTDRLDILPTSRLTDWRFFDFAISVILPTLTNAQQHLLAYHGTNDVRDSAHNSRSPLYPLRHLKSHELTAIPKSMSSI